MFERTISLNDTEKGRVSVTLTLGDSRQVTGHMLFPKALKLSEALNRAETFIEFETLDGEAIHYNKNAVRAVAPADVPKANQLHRPVRDHSAFDPYAILGIERGASAEAVRIAYIGLARMYHPDRFSSIDLPKEMKAYADAMATRINLAYQQLNGSDMAANQA